MFVWSQKPSESKNGGGRDTVSDASVMYGESTGNLSGFSWLWLCVSGALELAGGD